MMMNEPGLPGGVNPLDFLYKLATQRGLTRPEFHQLGEQGLPHNKIFMWQCSFHNIVAQGSGRSKKEAKVAAARAVRDQLNFGELPPPPTFQSVMEKKKRKFQSDSGGENADNGNEAKSRKYDYSRHFQCYSGGNQQSNMMGLPYGYLPDRQSAGNGMMMGNDGCFEAYYNDPYMINMMESEQTAYEQPPDATASPMGKGFMSRLSKLDRYVIKRHTEIYPTDAQLTAVLKLVADVEDAIKKVSKEWNEASDNKIKIEGLVSCFELIFLASSYRQPSLELFPLSLCALRAFSDSQGFLFVLVKKYMQLMSIFFSGKSR